MKCESPTDSKNLNLSGTLEKYLNLVLIPLCLAIAIQEVTPGSLLDVASSIKSATENFETTHGSEPQFGKYQHDNSITCLIHYLWWAYYDHTQAPVFSTNSNVILEE